MRQAGKHLLIVLLIIAASVFLTSCADNSAPQTDKVNLTALQYELKNQNINFSNMWFYSQLEEKTGIHVDFEAVKDADWSTRLNLMFASGSMHDMILRGAAERGTADAEEYGAAQHLLVALDDYLVEHMPNYYSRLQIDNIKDSIQSSDGKSYFIGYLLSQNVNTNGHFFINREWLNALGLDVPTTISELTDVLRAFRDGDPNGNGLKDEMPYQATFDDTETGIYNIFSAWGIPMNQLMVYVDSAGTVRFAPAQPAFRDAVEWLHMLCEEKLLDVECITQGSNIWGAKMNQKNTGFFTYWRLSNTVLSEAVAAQYQCMLPVHADGYEAKMSRIEDTVEFGAALTISNTHIEDSLHWLDAQFETETMLVAQNGPVGELLNKRDDGRYEVLRVPEANELYKQVPIICGQFFAPQSYYDQVYVPAPHRLEKQEYSAMYEEAHVLEDVSHYQLAYAPRRSDESTRISNLTVQLKKIVNAALVSFMIDGVTDENYAAFQASLKSAGMDEYCSLYQTVYDRRMVRRRSAQ